MEANKINNLKRAKRTQIGGNRHYEIGPDTAVPSVTTVLSKAGWTNYGLQQWSREQDPEDRIRIMRSAAAIGTRAHSIIEKVMTGEKVDKKKDVANLHARVLIEALKRFDRLYRFEVPLYSEEYLYAGTADAIGKVDGQLTVIEFKTGAASISGDIQHELLHRYGLQVAAYGAALQERLKLPELPAIWIGRSGGGVVQSVFTSGKIVHSLVERFRTIRALYSD